MTGILFICWGNICRSPAAALIFADLARRAGRENDFLIDSAGVSDEEEGNRIYPPMRRVLEARALDCAGHCARMLRRSDYEAFDLLVCMDELTIGRARRFFGGDPEDKVKNLLDYAGRPGEEARRSTTPGIPAISKRRPPRSNGAAARCSRRSAAIRSRWISPPAATAKRSTPCCAEGWTCRNTSAAISTRSGTC